MNLVRGAATIIERAGKILLLQRSTAVSRPGLWNLPTGGVELGETVEQGAAREVAEEAGLRVLSLAPLVRARTSRGSLWVFYATRWEGKVQLNEESQAFTWVPRTLAYEFNLLAPQREVLRWFATSRAA